MKYLIIILISLSVYSQDYYTVQRYMSDTTYIPFRGDTLMILDGPLSYSTPEMRIMLFNIDFFGLPYYEMMGKHKIKFDAYLHEQIDKIFKNEKWIEEAKKLMNRE